MDFDNFVSCLKKRMTKDFYPEENDGVVSDSYIQYASTTTPTESLLKTLATGQLNDVINRRTYMNEQELEEYLTEEYPCDYITHYNSILARKKEELRRQYDEINRSKKGGSSAGSSVPPESLKDEKVSSGENDVKKEK